MFMLIFIYIFQKVGSLPTQLLGSPAVHVESRNDQQPLQYSILRDCGHPGEDDVDVGHQQGARHLTQWPTQAAMAREKKQNRNIDAPLDVAQGVDGPSRRGKSISTGVHVGQVDLREREISWAALYYLAKNITF